MRRQRVAGDGSMARNSASAPFFSLALPLSHRGDRITGATLCSLAMDGGTLSAPKGVFSLSAVVETSPSTAQSFFLDAPEKVRIEIEWDGAAFRRRSLPATSRSSGEIFSSLVTFGLGIFDCGETRVCTLKSFPLKKLELEQALITLLNPIWINLV
jgi:hypothetical protein